MLPFEIIFKKELPPNLKPDVQKKIMERFKMEFDLSGADIDDEGNNKISFKRGIFTSDAFPSGAEKKWFSIGKASFEIMETLVPESKKAVYSFSIGRLMISLIAIDLSVIFYFITFYEIKFETGIKIAIGLLITNLFILGWTILEHYSMFKSNFKNFSKEAF